MTPGGSHNKIFTEPNAANIICYADDTNLLLTGANLPYIMKDLDLQRLFSRKQTDIKRRKPTLFCSKPTTLWSHQ